MPGFAGRFPYYGTQVHFPRGAPVFRAVCESGFEPEIIDRLVRLARPDTTIFDVGANIGLMAIPVLHACSTCRVISFEPSPNSLPFLQRTAAASGFGDRWLVKPKALSNTTGEMDFTIGRPNDALFEGFRSGERISDSRQIRVPVSTVDKEWDALGRPPVSVVKIDVEGAEALVLDGALQLLAAQRPALLVEWHEPYLARFNSAVDIILTIAQRFDYQLFAVPGGVSVPDAVSLRVQMMGCQNFLLMPGGRP